MLDADLKKLLSELKLDAVVELLEKNEPPPPPEVRKEEIAPPQEIVIEEKEEVKEEAPVQIEETKDEVLILHDTIDALAESLNAQDPVVQDPVVQEVPVQEEASTPSISRYAFFLLIPIALFGFYFIGGDQQERISQREPMIQSQENEPSLLEKITNMAPDVGHAIKLFTTTLKKREEELCQIADRLSVVLYTNAKKGFDYGVQEGALLLSRYDAVNTRFAQNITQELSLIESIVVKSDNPLLLHYFNELLSEQGLQGYTSYHADLVRQLVKQESAYRACLDAVEKSETLQALQQNVASARHALDGLSTGFSDFGLLGKELASSVGVTLQRLQPENGAGNQEEIEPLLQLIFAESRMGEEEMRHWEEAYLFSPNLSY
jgi:hypothetical protein